MIHIHLHMNIILHEHVAPPCLIAKNGSSTQTLFELDLYDHKQGV